MSLATRSGTRNLKGLSAILSGTGGAVVGVAHIESIRRFLGACRRRLLWLRVAAGVAQVLSVALGTLLLLAALASRVAFYAWGPVAVFVVAAVTAGVFFSTSYRRIRALDDVHLVREVGLAAPWLESDIRSVLELSREWQRGQARFSRDLLLALETQVAGGLAGLRPARVVRAVELGWPLAGLALVLLAYAAALTVAPDAMRTGFARLLVLPPQAPTLSADEPIVADLTVRYIYPPHTGRASQTVVAFSGDLLAPKGTRVELEARSLVDAESAEVHLDTKRVLAEMASGRLRVAFTIEAQGTYRFVVKPRGKRGVLRAGAHRITLEEDRPPRVELFAASDEIEVLPQRKIELGYQADDDYGIAEVVLVWRVGDGPEERRTLRRLAPPERSVEGKLEWDLAGVALKPGSRVAYRVEARDNDGVAGPKVGASRTLYLKVTSPREKHEALIVRQAELFEGLLGILADRLELPSRPTDENASAIVRNVAETHRREEMLVQQMGAMVSAIRADPLAPSVLGETMGTVAERLGPLLQRESERLKDLGARERKQLLRAGEVGRLLEENGRHVEALERLVILLDDLLGRQRIEGLVQVAEEMAHARDRLRTLLAEYRKSRDEKVKHEIAQLVAQLEARAAELEARMGELAQELPDEFLNREAILNLSVGERLAELREMLEHGDVTRAMEALTRLSRTLDDLARVLDGNLRAFRRERFAAEERALSRMLDRLADISAAQEAIAGETGEVAERLRQRVREATRNTLSEVARRLIGDSEWVAKKLGEMKREALTQHDREVLDRARQRTEDLRRALGEGDLEEARGMARAAAAAIEMLTEDLRDEVAVAPWRQPGRGEAVSRSLDRAEEALPKIAEIVDAIEQALPRQERLLGADERARLAQLAVKERETMRRLMRLQSELGGGGKRGDGESAGGAEKGDAEEGAAQEKGKGRDHAPDMPTLPRESVQALEAAAAAMAKAEGRLRANDPGEARRHELEALEALARLREGLKMARQPRFSGQVGLSFDRSPVRIPGAQEQPSRREFRQELLEAMKAKVPAPFEELVRRYYRELVR